MTEAAGSAGNAAPDKHDDGFVHVPGVVATPKPASTVAVIRDGERGIETWMMRRVKARAFAPGAAVFPGGSVDERDADVSVPWSGSDPETFAARFGTDPRTARELVTAALRELFEETGALLANPLPDVDLDAARIAIEARELPLAQFLADHGSVLDAGALHPWARWVTPAVETRRYDTWFFVATLPEGVEAQAVSSEADVAGWVVVQDMLDANERGENRLLPPTIAMLRALIEGGTVAKVIAEAPNRSLEPIHPEVRRGADGKNVVTAAGVVFGGQDSPTGAVIPADTTSPLSAVVAEAAVADDAAAVEGPTA
jgi:8-oxo-dGTP pyrophosphatase MutT (NUDIX family)